MRTFHLGKRDLIAFMKCVVKWWYSQQAQRIRCRNVPSIEKGGEDCCGLCADWRTDCLAHRGVPDEPSACETDAKSEPQRLCWSMWTNWTDFQGSEHPISAARSGVSLSEVFRCA
jgi:hypothetical protein